MTVKANETTVLTVEDQHIPSYVTLKKTSTNTELSSGNSNYTLAGAVYGVYSDSKCSNKVGELTTKADGTSNTLTVPAGTYYAKELTAPKGFSLNSDVLSVTVAVGKTGTFNAKDDPQSGSLKLTKSSSNSAVTNDIKAYALSGGNMHRAADDAAATLELLCRMGEELDDLERYVNLFGYNPKYGVPRPRIASVTYRPQYYNAPQKLYETE